MIFLGKYDEFTPGMGYPSIMGYLRSTTYHKKEKLLRHLKSGRVHIATAARVIDVVTGEATGKTLLHMNDGKYSWTTKLIYHVEKYNLKLPQDVEDDILQPRETDLRSDSAGNDRISCVR